METRIRLLELYAGIGGCAAAVGRHAEVTAAVDQNRRALDVYRRNFDHPVWPRTVESLPADVFAGADLWWLSPPCQPYTRRGLSRDLADPRAASLPIVWQRIAEHRPRYIALESVPPFGESQARLKMMDTLARIGYTVRECVVCPTELGWPNRRRRYYLVATRAELLPWPETPGDADLVFAVADILDEHAISSSDTAGEADAELLVSPDLLKRYAGAIDIVDGDDLRAVTSCFTSAYGRSPVRSGSYLRTPCGVRRFSPREILTLLGFPADFALPSELSVGEAWRLIGNSLSLPAVRWVLSCVPELEHLRHAPNPSLPVGAQRSS